MKKIAVSFAAVCVFVFISCTDKESATRLYVQAVNAYVEENFENSKALAKRCLESDSSFFQANFLLGKIAYFEGDYKAAERIMQKLCKKIPEFTEARIWYIRILIALEKYDEAEVRLKEEETINSSDWRIYYQYALLAGKRDRTDERLSMCRKAEALLDDGAKVYVEMADMWIKMGLRSNAIECLDKALVVSHDKQALEELKAFLESGKDIL